MSGTNCVEGQLITSSKAARTLGAGFDDVEQLPPFL